VGFLQAWLVDKALDCKRDILTMPLPDRDDDSVEAIRMRALILDAANSTIEQTIRLQTNTEKLGLISARSTIAFHYLSQAGRLPLRATLRSCAQTAIG
jgi:hypothetical protein